MMSLTINSKSFVVREAFKKKVDFYTLLLSWDSSIVFFGCFRKIIIVSHFKLI